MAAPKKSLPVKTMVAAYNKGASLTDLARKHGTDSRTVRARLVEAGVQIRAK